MFHQLPRRRCEGTAMGVIILDLRPGLGFGPFSLGIPISEAFAQIEQQPNIYDVVNVYYYNENPSAFLLTLEPLMMDIVISFPDHGFHLRFDPWSQVHSDSHLSECILHSENHLSECKNLLETCCAREHPDAN